jgi:hypothetical protein
VTVLDIEGFYTLSYGQEEKFYQWESSELTMECFVADSVVDPKTFFRIWIQIRILKNFFWIRIRIRILQTYILELTIPDFLSMAYEHFLNTILRRKIF